MYENLYFIKKLINLNNSFINNAKDIININFFNIKHNNLIQTTTKNIIEIIKLNAKPWICCDNINRSEIFILFDLETIENEINNKCIIGKKKLNVKYNNFEFISNKNMFKLLQSLKIKQEILDGKIYYKFEKQFETNAQKKKYYILLKLLFLY